MRLRSALQHLLSGRFQPKDQVSDAAFRKVVEQSADVLCKLIDGQFRYVSPSALSTFGWTPGEMIGKDELHVVFDQDRSKVVEVINDLLSGQRDHAVIQVRVVCGDGSLKWAETNARVDLSGPSVEAVLVMRDITERKMLEDKLAALALQDGLTGLANRRAFDQALDDEWKRTVRSGSEMALLLLDIDCFKQFNDSYGHQVGDDCLKAVAGCMKELIRRPTDIACRYGGEELVAILGTTGLEAATGIAARIRSAVEALAIPHQGSTCAEVVTVSVGVAAAVSRAGGTMEMPQGLLQAADHALYKAKTSGRNRVETSVLIAPSHQLVN